jgi:tetratricopeptide (TPR) repeat protein
LASLPDPGGARTLDEFVERLRSLRVWAGSPSYDAIKERVNASWTKAGRPAGELTKKATVVDCFKTGRKRLNTDLVIAIVEALHPDVGCVAQWRQALRVIGGEIEAAAQIRVQDVLPPDLAEFTGRTPELDRLRQASHRALRAGAAVVVSAIEGMAGVGKTQLAVHASHLLMRENPFERVLFVNLRGFHPDPAQPPAHPAAVLDGFLRLLGVPGQQIPHDLTARATAYRDRLAGTPALVVLDNAADAAQVQPLLAGVPGCLTLVTSRRSLTDLQPAIRLTVDVFTPDEATAFLTRAVSDVAVGADPHAPARIAARCGHLPLALSLVAGHICSTPGWTLTDHADRLDERHQHRHLDFDVQLALDLSYQILPTDRQRLLRLASLHPGQDFDAYAAAALTDTDLPTTQNQLHHLYSDHLLQQATPGRYTFHDLVRAYAADRAVDQDRPLERRAALTRLFDHYLAAAAAAMDTLHPAETHRRPRIAASTDPAPDLTNAEAARRWLDDERPTLIAAAAYTAGHGWPAWTVALSTTLVRYLDGGYDADALAVHGHARRAAHQLGDATSEAHALTYLGTTHLAAGRYESAADHIGHALTLFRESGDLLGQARALTNLGAVDGRSGRYHQAGERLSQALPLFQQLGDRLGEAHTLGSLGVVQEHLGQNERAADHYRQAWILLHEAGDQSGAAQALCNLAEAEGRLGRHDDALGHLREALLLFRRLGNRRGEASALDSLGTLHTRLKQADLANRRYLEALDIFHDIGDREGEAWALNGLGEAANSAGRHADARTHHEAAHRIAAAIGGRSQEARAHTGLGRAHHAMADRDRARSHYEQALALYTELGLPQADEIRTYLTDLPE